MSDVVLVGTTKAHERAIRSAVGDTGEVRPWNGEVDGAKTAEKLTIGRPAVVVLGSELGESAVALAAAIEDLDPTVATLLIARSDTALLQKAMAAGVRGVLEPDATESDIEEAIGRVMEAGARLRGSHPELTPAIDRRFITVISAKGGAGKTVISSNLAVSLAENTERETVLVDLDLQFGDAATALLLTPDHSCVDAAGATRRGVDVAALKVFLTRHQASGLYVLCAPEEPSAGEEITTDEIGTVLDTIAGEFRQVVVDTDPGLSETTLTALERATDVVVVADLDVPSVRGTRKLLDALDLVGMTLATRHLVLNRADSKVGLTPAEVEEVVGKKIDVALPSTRQVPVSMNEGRPMVLSAPRSHFTKQFDQLVQRLVAAPAQRR